MDASKLRQNETCDYWTSTYASYYLAWSYYSVSEDNRLGYDASHRYKGFIIHGVQ